MNDDKYVIFSIDDGQKLIFIEKCQKVDTNKISGTMTDMEEYAKREGYELVDISSWKFESFEDKCFQVRNYSSSIHKR